MHAPTEIPTVAHAPSRDASRGHSEPMVPSAKGESAVRREQKVSHLRVLISTRCGCLDWLSFRVNSESRTGSGAAPLSA
jgi:hypothetical protein